MCDLQSLILISRSINLTPETRLKMKRYSNFVRSPSVLIVVVNFNGEEDTLACLHSLMQLEYSNYRVLIIDNGSKRSSAESIRTEFPKIPLIANNENLGFAAGNNIGLDHAKQLEYDYALLLNNDTEVAPDFLELLVQTAENDPSIAMLGPTIYYFDQPETIWSAGGEIDRNHGSAKMVGIDERDEGQYQKDCREVDFVTGCAILVRMDALELVGLIDPDFFVL